MYLLSGVAAADNWISFYFARVSAITASKYNIKHIHFRCILGCGSAARALTTLLEGIR